MAELSFQGVQQLIKERASLRAALGMLLAAWNRERALLWAGLCGLMLGLVGLVVMAVHGRFIAPDGDLAKPIAFNAALGIYALTLAPLVPLAGFSTRLLNRWRVTQVAIALGSFAVANIQTYRGIDPRFPRSGMPLDLLASILFGILAVGGSVTFLMLAVRLFRRPADAGDGLVVLATRYGSIAATVGYVTGLWMILNGGARFGERGDILPLHALGFHGLQAVPLLAFLFIKGSIAIDTARGWTHLAGATWVGVCVGAGWQTILGRSLLEPAPASAVTLVLLVTWGFAMLRAIQAWCCGVAASPKCAHSTRAVAAR